ncbi:hypothetical protein [Methylocystis sp.]|uniref:hypothetical protein n=1 Tax=Methylocystis sp. TaxID=1911079 RepID=UPI003DA62DE2
MPSAIGAEFKTGTSDAERTFVNDFYKPSIAIDEPADVDLFQIVERPTVQEF